MSKINFNGVKKFLRYYESKTGDSDLVYNMLEVVVKWANNMRAGGICEKDWLELLKQVGITDGTDINYIKGE